MPGLSPGIKISVASKSGHDTFVYSANDIFYCCTELQFLRINTNMCAAHKAADSMCLSFLLSVLILYVI